VLPLRGDLRAGRETAEPVRAHDDAELAVLDPVEHRHESPGMQGEHLFIAEGADAGVGHMCSEVAVEHAHPSRAGLRGSVDMARVDGFDRAPAEAQSGEGAQVVDQRHDHRELVRRQRLPSDEDDRRGVFDLHDGQQ